MLYDDESMMWDLCDRLALLGAGREGCRILGTSEPYRRSYLAWELGRHEDVRVRLVRDAAKLTALADAMSEDG